LDTNEHHPRAHPRTDAKPDYKNDDVRTFEARGLKTRKWIYRPSTRNKPKNQQTPTTMMARKTTLSSQSF